MAVVVRPDEAHVLAGRSDNTRDLVRTVCRRRARGALRHVVLGHAATDSEQAVRGVGVDVVRGVELLEVEAKFEVVGQRPILPRYLRRETVERSAPETERQRETEAERWRERETETDRDRETERWRQRERGSDGEMERLRDEETESNGAGILSRTQMQ